MKTVLDREEAEKVVVSFTPRKFPQSISPVAREFVSMQAAQENPRFRIDRMVAGQAGVADLERDSIEQQVERLALEKLKEMQETAYREAYQLGLEEGREHAFAEHKAILEKNMASMESLLAEISSLKTALLDANEAHLMKILFHMASKVALDEIRMRPEIILSVLKQAVGNTQSDERITVRVARADFEFIQSMREKLGRDMDFIERVRIEEADNVLPGGCVVETDFGSVDASIEKRVEKLWDAIREKLPKIDERISGE